MLYGRVKVWVKFTHRFRVTGRDRVRVRI